MELFSFKHDDIQVDPKLQPILKSIKHNKSLLILITYLKVVPAKVLPSSSEFYLRTKG